MGSYMLYRLVFIVICQLFSLHSYSAVDPYEFSSDEDRKRYRTLIEELRCPKCKNNNLAGTNSQIAVDLRREIQKKVVGGDSNEQIIDFMVTRYGDFVLYRPRMTGKTMYVWFGPLLIFGVGVVAIAVIVKRRRRIAPQSSGPSLTAEEQEQLKAILGASKEDDKS